MNAKVKSSWIEDILNEVKKHIKTRKYRITLHAKERQEKYKITLPEVLFVLSNGVHEKEKTLFSN